jgi:hypothetical protein
MDNIGSIGSDHYNGPREEEKRFQLSVQQARAAEAQASAARAQASTAKIAVEVQKKALRTQRWTVILALVATVAAAYAAWQAGNAVKASERSAAQQATENRLAMAVTALGEKSSTDQVAGLTLLRRNVHLQIHAANEDPSKREDAYDAYSTALDVVPVYLRENTKVGQNPPIAALYAAAELKKILEMGPDVKDINGGPPATIDLALVSLRGVNWTGIRFDWLAAAYMPKIDFRGADLANSRWGHATLNGADLQCADLKGADLRQANLIGVDLRGADLRNEPRATLSGRQLRFAIGRETCSWPPVGRPDGRRHCRKSPRNAKNLMMRPVLFNEHQVRETEVWSVCSAGIHQARS